MTFHIPGFTLLTEMPPYILAERVVISILPTHPLLEILEAIFFPSLHRYFRADGRVSLKTERICVAGIIPDGNRVSHPANNAILFVAH